VGEVVSLKGTLVDNWAGAKGGKTYVKKRRAIRLADRREKDKVEAKGRGKRTVKLWFGGKDRGL